jgi:hypothetical protein
MNNKNKIVNLGYQVATVIIEFMLFIFFKYIHLYLLLTIKVKTIMGIIIIK